MRSSLIAVAVTALLGGLVIAPVTQQSAQAQVLGEAPDLLISTLFATALAASATVAWRKCSLSV
jgi:hypothetical protein